MIISGAVQVMKDDVPIAVLHAGYSIYTFEDKKL